MYTESSIDGTRRRHSSSADQDNDGQNTASMERFVHSNDTKTMTSDVNKQRRAAGRWRLVTFFLLLLCIGLVIGLIVVVVSDHSRKSDDSSACGGKEDDIDTSEPKEPSVFHDLTAKEVDGMMNYLYAQKSLNLEETPTSTNSSFIYLSELYLPKKTDVLQYLDHKGTKPNRDAIVTIMRGDAKDQYVAQYIVGPLPEPTYMKPVPGYPDKVKFEYRPLNGIEMSSMVEFTNVTVDANIRSLLKESFGGTLINCGNKCLVFYVPVPVSSAVTGLETRMFWMRMQQFVDTFILHPVGFAVLISSTRNGFKIESITYNDVIFNNFQDLIQAYNSGTVGKLSLSFPTDDDNSFSKMTTRGESFQDEFKRDPIQVEPDGKRYSVHNRHANYMGWDFHFRMSSAFGPQVYDVRFKNERVAYEISLQEISVLYSGHQTPQMFTDYFDSCALIGVQGKGLVPGIDCPAGATFVDASHVVEGFRSPINFKNAFCIYEWNTGIPLRRHHSFSSTYKSYFEGAPSNVLILRTALTIVNYDYIFDYIFYQNGVIEVKATSTGYVLATMYSDAERKYGAQIHDRINANLHLHLFNFKVDMDIKGTNNRFATLDISPADDHNPMYTDPNVNYHMTQFQAHVKQNETQGAYKYNFDSPKYLIFYNEAEKNKYGNPKAYRLLMKGMVKQLVKEGSGNEPSLAWARYQMAATRYHETERHSSSFYAFLNADNPVVNFQKFIDDDESIVDQDLVAWVTMGVHHIPHTEDLPVTPSPGMGLNFFLLPYNYFSEDQGMATKSAVRIEYKNPNDLEDGIVIKRFQSSNKDQCTIQNNPYWDIVKQSPSILLDSGAGGGTAV